MSGNKIFRKDFIIKTCKIIGAGILSSYLPEQKVFARSPLTGDDRALTVIRGGDLSKSTIEEMVVKGLDSMGGIGSFIRSGMKVVIKPNIGWNSGPELAHNTNPDLVEIVAKLCVNAGASVKIMDNPVHTPQLTYRRSGMVAAAANAGASLEFMDERKFRTVRLKDGIKLETLDVYEDILNADFVINMPVAKDHASSVLTMSMKNMMGAIGGRRGAYHTIMHPSIVDFNKAAPSNLVILDALRILTDHGPASGTLRDVLETRTIIMGKNPVTVDAYTTGLFRQSEKHRNITPEKIGYLKIAAGDGMGEINTRNMTIKTIQV